MCSMNACTCTSVPVHRHVSRPEMDIGVQHIEPYSSETGPLTEPEVSQQAPGFHCARATSMRPFLAFYLGGWDLDSCSCIRCFYPLSRLSGPQYSIFVDSCTLCLGVKVQPSNNCINTKWQTMCRVHANSVPCPPTL